MNHAWFRMYNEVVDDPKVQRLPAPMFRAWINFMCIASKHGGVLPEITDVAYTLRVTPIKAEFLLKGLVEAGLFEWRNGIAAPHNWEGRQYKSDSSTARVQQWRNARGNDERNVSCNVSVTGNETAHTEQNRTEQTPKPHDGESEYSLEFLEKFWRLYPRKAGKGEAWKSWQKIKPSQALQDKIGVAIALQRTSRDWLREDGKYIPNPSTWLNQKRWDDEVADESVRTMAAVPRFVG